MSNLHVIGAFVAVVDLAEKSPAAFRDLTFFMHNLFCAFHPPPEFFHFFLYFFYAHGLIGSMLEVHIKVYPRLRNDFFFLLFF
jgi:hypothetical protein